jgi:hypothetical protein
VGFTSEADTATRFTSNLFYFGNVTPASALPRTGNALYNNGYTLATFIPSSTTVAQSNLAGNSSLSVDFSRNTITASVTFFPDSIFPLRGGFSGSGVLSTSDARISSSAFNLPFDSNSAQVAGTGITGSLSGALFGPTANEFGFTYQINIPSATSTSIINTAGQINGVAVGTR